MQNECCLQNECCEEKREKSLYEERKDTITRRFDILFDETLPLLESTICPILKDPTPDECCDKEANVAVCDVVDFMSGVISKLETLHRVLMDKIERVGL